MRMKGFLNRLLGRNDGSVDESQPVNIDEERSETAAVDSYGGGGFDPQSLIQDDRPQNDW
jgi:hypothetical protein